MRDNAETPLARRFTTGAAGASALAFVILVIADLDSVVYGDAGLAHLGRAALWATTTGLIVTVLASYDPRLSATSRTIESKSSATTGHSGAVSYLRSSTSEQW